MTTSYNVEMKRLGAAHKLATDASDEHRLADLEGLALELSDRYGFPINNPNLMLASYWPAEEKQ